MSDYTFSTLNDQEFEDLVRDLLNAKFRLDLRSYKPGRDKGIDLRHSTEDDDNAVVVQVKHYLRSGFPKLIRVLKNEELGKIKALAPTRYLVATSLALNPDDQERIRETMSPYVESLADVIGNEELNKYLAEFAEIEKWHFKLWFSSVSLLDRILNNAIEGRTQHLLDQIAKKFPKYVVTKRLDEANKILERQRVLMITGQPGIGKTTLAQIIIFERLKMDFKIHEVTNIREAEDMISADNDVPELFYMDDFLGDIHLELLSGRVSGSDIARFIERVRNSRNKYLLLTTRTVILQSAITHFEKLRRTGIAERKFELMLDNYTSLQKARILYNHIYFSEIGDLHCRAIIAGKFYKRIIDHRNFTPRLIEFITNSKAITGKTVKGFQDFVLHNLDNPAEIWRDSFYNQIGYFDRCFLDTLFTFADSVSQEQLERSFSARLEYEKIYNHQSIRSDQFRQCVKTLLNGFITETKDDKTAYFALINPSLADFIEADLENSMGQIFAVAASVTMYVQLSRFESHELRPIEIQEILARRILDEEIDLQQFVSDSGNYRTTLKLEWLAKMCPDLELDEVFAKNLAEMDPADRFHYFRPVADFVGSRKDDLPTSFQFMKANFGDWIKDVLSDIEDPDDAQKIPGFFDLFEQDFVAYSRTDEGDSVLSDVLVSTMQTAYVRNVDDRSNEFYETNDVEVELEQLEEVEDQLDKLFFRGEVVRSYHPPLVPRFDKDHWTAIVEENRAGSTVYAESGSHCGAEEASRNDAADEIDSLFSRLTIRT